MNFILSLGVKHYLTNADDGCKEGMIGKEDIIEVNLASLSITYKVSFRIIDWVEHKSCQIHGHEIKVHALNTESLHAYLLTLKLM